MTPPGSPTAGYARGVKVAVKLFAALRERAGTRERALELADDASIEDVWPALGLGEEPAGLVYAVNRAYVDRSHALADGDEIALIPPVSGGAFLLSDAPLSLERVAAEVASDDAGAIATFVGTTRARSRGRDVIRLEYEAYEGMAEAEMERIAGELRQRHDVIGVAIHHRVGPVEIGETSVVIAVSAPHRAAAFDACRDAIDTLKQTVPLWKKELYVGGEEWIGQGS
jgi:molybdopterin synthase catalytic subunit/molybdopterin converting factor small subunit